MIHSILTPVLIIDFIGISIGLLSIYYILAQGQRLGGKVGGALNLFVWGVIFQILAFSYTVVFSRLKLFPDLTPTIDIHHLLMATGMILFVLAARKFASLLSA
ncbi:MAG: hypothetical protein KJI71_04915 [Patescibacteria group bacterium]|nr:hypothetical protein [Patescibacteria group bacterium]